MKKLLLIPVLQVALLLLAVGLGVSIYGSPDATLKLMHRATGFMAALVGVAALVACAKHTSRVTFGVGVVAVIANFVAGLAGASLRTTESYDQMFMTMRGMGMLALLLAISFTVMVYRNGKVATMSSGDTDEE